MIQRRLYVYIVAAASLAMLLVGVVNLGTTALNQLFNTTPTYSNARDDYARFGAVTLVGLIVWSAHWYLAQRLAGRNNDERASAIRRLYVYAALAATGVALAIFLRRFIEDVLGVVMTPSGDGAEIARAAFAGIVVGGFWLYHLRTAALDRTRVGETGTSATLRRWYAYGLLLFGLVFLLFGARDLLQDVWVLLVEKPGIIAPGVLIPTAVATLLTGLLVWGFHSEWTARPPLSIEDRRSTLRTVQRFIALAGSVILTLFGLSQLLYYALARLLGLEHPGGVTTSLLVALASPAATAIVFAVSWWWVREQLAADARQTEAARQAAVRHLYVYLIALVSLGTLAIGAAGLLWTLWDQVIDPVVGRSAPEWRDRVSLFVTLMVVAAPMWWVHWRPNPDSGERSILSRRLYLYAALLGSVLAALVGAAIFLNNLLAIILGSTSAANGDAALSIGHGLAVVLVAAVIGVYHWRVVQADNAARPVPPPSPHDAEPGGGEIRISVSGATREQIERVLEDLPKGASYSIEP